MIPFNLAAPEGVLDAVKRASDAGVDGVSMSPPTGPRLQEMEIASWRKHPLVTSLQETLRTKFVLETQRNYFLAEYSVIN